MQLTNSAVNGIILPPLSALFPLNRSLGGGFAVLTPGPNYDSAAGYTTLRQAIDDGAAVMAYGVINFVGIGIAQYALARVYQLFSKDPIIEAAVQCRYCKKSVKEKVSLPAYPPRPVIRLTGQVGPLASTAQAGKMDAKNARCNANPAIREFIRIHVKTPTAEEPTVVRETEGKSGN
ncbi:hypothetical protein DL771_012321 [Monosporascus sp. 5C6A]|nr:hypothetical protein DL771_012321 [Monosporascus sp. 5C6A]